MVLQRGGGSGGGVAPGEAVSLYTLGCVDFAPVPLAVNGQQVFERDDGSIVYDSLLFEEQGE